MQKNREKAQQRAGQGKQVARSGSQAKILLNNKKQNAERAVSEKTPGGARESNQNRQLAQVQDQLKELNKQHEMLKQQKYRESRLPHSGYHRSAPALYPT